MGLEKRINSSDTPNPFDSLEQHTLSEQIEPYRIYCEDDESTDLAIALWEFERRFSQTDGAAPCDNDADYLCTLCDVDVRGICGRGADLTCPICGEEPNMLMLHMGPQNEEKKVR